MRATSMLEDQRLRPGGGLWWLSLITCSGASGWIVAHRVQMTELPKLVVRSTALSGLRRSSSGSTPMLRWPDQGPARHGRRHCHRVERHREPGGAHSDHRGRVRALYPPGERRDTQCGPHCPSRTEADAIAGSLAANAAGSDYPRRVVGEESRTSR